LIVTLTINPAIDRIIGVDRLAFEDRAYVASVHESAGGRGVNVSSAIHSFGGETLAVLISGGEAGKRLETLLSGRGFRVAIVPVKNEIRTNLTITDKQGLSVYLDESGPLLDNAEVAQVERVVRQSIGHATWLMVGGRIPPGVPSNFYGKLLTMARRKKVHTLLHADGEALRQGIEARPTVVTPNQQEAERLLDRTLLTRSQFLEAAAQIRAMGAESVVLSLASRGAVGAFREGLVEALPPRIDAVSPIGSGDALSAGFAWAMEQKADPIDALRWGVSAGTASALLPGTNFANLEQTQAIYRQVEIRRAD
jgi:1-phosphofructokinase family hexose kinase